MIIEPGVVMFTEHTFLLTSGTFNVTDTANTPQVEYLVVAGGGGGGG